MSAHPCPGCSKPGIPRHLFACRPCWYRLPADLRSRITYGWRNSAAAHLAAMAEAAEFYASESDR